MKRILHAVLRWLGLPTTPASGGRLPERPRGHGDGVFVMLSPGGALPLEEDARCRKAKMRRPASKRSPSPRTPPRPSRWPQTRDEDHQPTPPVTPGEPRGVEHADKTPENRRPTP